MPKLYTRNQGGNLRYYADLRDIGGGQVALKPPESGASKAIRRRRHRPHPRHDAPTRIKTRVDSTGPSLVCGDGLGIERIAVSEEVRGGA